MDSNNILHNKEQVASTINSLIELIKNPSLPYDKVSYYFHKQERRHFFVYLYIYKLLINDKDYIETKYNKFLNKITFPSPYDITKITNIEATDELDLILKLKTLLTNNNYYYNSKENRIYINDKYVETKWFLSCLSIILDNTINSEIKEINICYTIPNKDISRVEDKKDKDKFLEEFCYYRITVRRTDLTKPVKENNILVVKNAAINYLKHLKQYKHGLENEESYMIFYNLLKNECRREGYDLKEQEINLLNTDLNFIEKIDTYLDDEFYALPLSKQVQIIENIVWQSSNDITLLEHMNTSIDKLMDMLTILYLNKDKSYLRLKERRQIPDIKLLLILITSKFLLTYLNPVDELDYSLLDLSNIKPKYMNSICRVQEQEIKNKIRGINMELAIAKRKLDKYKEERASLNKDTLGPQNYKKELELCVGNINRISITIARLNSNISSLNKDYDIVRKDLEGKYNNIELYNHNHSIIRHLCNSILGCSFYLKTNNNSALLSNIIIFEDYEKTDNSFYLEVSFKELLKISNQYILNGIIDQNDLPKLA